MNLWDMIILATLVLGALAGWRSGLIRQALGLAGIVAGILIGVALMETVGRMLAPLFRMSEGIAPIVGFIAVFIGVQVLAVVGSNVLGGVAASLRLTLLNRIGGGLVGAAKAAVIASLFFLVLDQTGQPGQDARARSSLYEPVALVIPALWEYLRGMFPDMVDIAERFGERIIQEVQEP